MVSKRLTKLDKNPLCGVIHFVCEIICNSNFAYSRVVLSFESSGIADVQLSIGQEIWVEYQTEETLFGGRPVRVENGVRNVEKRNVANATSVLMECVNKALLLSNEDSPSSIFRGAEDKRVAQTGSEMFKAETTFSSDCFSHNVSIQNGVR